LIRAVGLVLIDLLACLREKSVGLVRAVEEEAESFDPRIGCFPPLLEYSVGCET